MDPLVNSELYAVIVPWGRVSVYDKGLYSRPDRNWGTASFAGYTK